MISDWFFPLIMASDWLWSRLLSSYWWKSERKVFHIHPRGSWRLEIKEFSGSLESLVVSPSNRMALASWDSLVAQKTGSARHNQKFASKQSQNQLEKVATLLQVHIRKQSSNTRQTYQWITTSGGHEFRYLNLTRMLVSFRSQLD